MNQLTKLYIFLYFFYSYFGYNVIYRINSNKRIDYALLNKRSYAFIGKRIFMLSHLVFLYSAYFLEYPNNDKYINTLGLHIIVNSGYFIIWRFKEKSTFFMHLFWSFPIIIYKNIYYNHLEINLYKYEFNNENIILFILLFVYSQNYKYIYTPRLIYIDKEK